MSASGIVGKRCQHPYENAVQVKQAMIASSTNRYLLLDHTKFARKALYTFAEITDFDAVVVTPQPPEIRDELAGHGSRSSSPSDPNAPNNNATHRAD